MIGFDVVVLSENGEEAVDLVLEDRMNYESSGLLEELGFLKRKLAKKFIANMKFNKTSSGFRVTFKKRMGKLISMGNEVIKYSMARHGAYIDSDYEINVVNV